MMNMFSYFIISLFERIDHLSFYRKEVLHCTSGVGSSASKQNFHAILNKSVKPGLRKIISSRALDLLVTSRIRVIEVASILSGAQGWNKAEKRRYLLSRRYLSPVRSCITALRQFRTLRMCLFMTVKKGDLSGPSSAIKSEVKMETRPALDEACSTKSTSVKQSQTHIYLHLRRNISHIYLQQNIRMRNMES